MEPQKPSRRFILTSLADLTHEQVVRIAQFRDREMVLDVFSQIRRVAGISIPQQADRATPVLVFIEALAQHAPWLQGQALRATFLSLEQGRRSMFSLCACETPTRTRSLCKTSLEIPFRYFSGAITRLEHTQLPDVSAFVAPWSEDKLTGCRVLFRKRASAPVNALPSVAPKRRIDTLRPQSLSVPPPPSTHVSFKDEEPPPIEELTDEDLVEDAGEPDDEPIPLVRRTESQSDDGPTYSRMFV